MLAKVYRPENYGGGGHCWFVQPKLDGMRMLYDCDSGVGKSRNGKENKTGRLATLLHALRAASFSDVFNHAAGDVRPRMLDGELYRHGDSFHDIMTAVHAGDPTLEYHVFDIVDANMPFPARYDLLARVLASAPAATRALVKLVPTVRLDSSEEVEAYLDTTVGDGYEGIMLRSPEGVYESKRSSRLLKYKRFQDAEFLVVGFKPHALHGVVWKCSTAGGGTFFANPTAALHRQTTNANPVSFVGLKLTVKYQDIHVPSGVPRFPIAKAFRVDDNCARFT